MKRLVLLSLFVLFSSGGYSYSIAQDDAENRTKLLVSPDWLEAAIAKENAPVIVDLAFRKTNYESGHIPGAIFLDWRSDIIDSEKTDLYRLPGKSAMEKLLSSIGVTPDSTIVLTDNMANRAAVRFYYTLKYFDHKHVKVLNGGTHYWKKTGRKLTTAVPTIRPAEYKIQTTNDDYFVKLEAVRAAISNSKQQMIDGRPTNQFTGEVPGKVFHTNRAHNRLGHVPSAINIPWTENLNQDGTFKTLKELRELYASNGIDVDGEIITYCNEGLHAAMPWFILRELFGNDEIRLYDDSMAEWANRDDTPLKTSLADDQ